MISKAVNNSFEHKKICFTYIENFKTSNIQYTNEIVSLILGVKGLVYSGYQPFEHTVIQRFSHSTDGI